MKVTHGVLREDWEQIQRESNEQAQRVIENAEQPRYEQSEPQSEAQSEVVTCKVCEVGFNNSHDMKIHKKTSHGSHKPCRNFSLVDHTMCPYGQYCTFSHIPIIEGNTDVLIVAKILTQIRHKEKVTDVVNVDKALTVGSHILLQGTHQKPHWDKSHRVFAPAWRFGSHRPVGSRK